MSLAALFAVVSLIALSACTPSGGQAPPMPLHDRGAGGSATPNRTLTPAVSFGVMGDIPYSDQDETHAQSILSDMHRSGMQFAIHVGDIKRSTERCSDELLARRVGLFLKADLPVLLLPGDNEWTDCHRRLAGGYDPLERLAALRALAWSTPDRLLGRSGLPARALPIERQPGQPENVRMVIDRLHVLAIHVVGSNNGDNDLFAGGAQNMRARMKANAQWLERGVELALEQDALGLVIGFHADPSFGPLPERGFETLQTLLQQAASRFSRPILLVHGDRHRFRVDQPLPGPNGPWTHVTRLESFGWPYSQQWVQVQFEAQASPPFRIVVRTAGPESDLPPVR